MEALILLLFVVACIVGIGLFRRYLAEKTLIRRREIMHQERMTAMEKGIPLDQLDQEALSLEPSIQPPSRKSALVWVRLTALCIGLVLLAAGIGVCVAFALIPEPEANDMWPLGFIPGLAGLGLLLFFGISSGFAAQLEVE